MGVGVIREPRPSQGLGSWRVRRAYLFGTTAFCMFTVAYILTNNMHGRVAETAVLMAFGTMASCTGAYVFTASWEDVRLNQTQHEYRARGWQTARRGRIDNPDGDDL